MGNFSRLAKFLIGTSLLALSCCAPQVVGSTVDLYSQSDNQIAYAYTPLWAGEFQAAASNANAYCSRNGAQAVLVSDGPGTWDPLDRNVAWFNCVQGNAVANVAQDQQAAEQTAEDQIRQDNNAQLGMALGQMVGGVLINRFLPVPGVAQLGTAAASMGTARIARPPAYSQPTAQSQLVHPAAPTPALQRPPSARIGNPVQHESTPLTAVPVAPTRPASQAISAKPSGPPSAQQTVPSTQPRSQVAASKPPSNPTALPNGVQTATTKVPVSLPEFSKLQCAQQLALIQNNAAIYRAEGMYDALVNTNHQLCH